MTSKKNNEPNKPEETTSDPVTTEVSTPETSSVETNASVSQPEPTVAPQTPPATTKDEQKKPSQKLSILAIIIALLGTGGVAFQLQQQNSQYQAQIAALQNQLQQTQSAMSNELNQVKQETVAKATEVTHKAEVVLAQQQKSIESLQLAMADVKGRRPNDWLLAEADYLVKLAGRKLFLEHDVVSATSLMESADQRIAALNDPSLVPLRKAMAKDITDLKTIPLIDRDGLVLRLTALQQQVDQLPLANAILPEAKTVEKQQVSDDINNWQNNLMASLKAFSENFITFRTRDGNVIPLLSPEQHFYLKENIKAKIETAIKAVYQEQGEVYTTSLTTAEAWSQAFFNQDNNTVKEFTQSLKQLSEQKIQVQYPVKLQTQNQLADVIRERLRREVTSMTSTEAQQ
ncbi:heme biosynthesis operon protein HemX [Vibrio vulnificus]|jgi:uroporphyrin-3 C-methyltransferase|uniref:Uroporphyrinogen-III C-methyltransferase n=1 Tax=Vibrio vulnificus TaxID=672 RepID=A0AAW4HEE9_VIBVL|nr:MULTISPECIES: uroporphyrinogen-III C-methyltransferase [Vibrio]EWS68812.1 uroporphyrin-III methyltransferase [Vibrio vulnificus BAA87]ASJ37260.1 heme biosynthesis operon protein HemX [Vibrio vulnificus]AUL97059.1 Uroporphyrinogen-III methyltransferase [Vibrio vulnificus]EGQ7694957.1 heme biosynthesis operon protein HemX [Vibrio vulnificus]EGQ7759141.1 heme biosynthesis operon protein HemX [Vibrio vulnificus]